jgi:hypothetical protein
MNFDDIKNEWDKEPTKQIKLPNSVQLLDGGQSPVLKIRKNMERELVVQIIAIIFAGFIPTIVEMEPLLSVSFYLFFILLVALTAYFFIKFYFFYNKIGKMEWSTKESLYELYYGAKLNIEVYKSFTYMFVPYAIILGMFIRVNYYYKYSQSALTGDLFYGFQFSTYLLGFTFALGLVYFLTEWWVSQSYGRYVRQIEKVIEEMREE